MSVDVRLQLAAAHYTMAILIIGYRSPASHARQWQMAANLREQTVTEAAWLMRACAQMRIRDRKCIATAMLYKHKHYTSQGY